jgi:alkylated DNA repair protein alkB family protein 6
MIAEEIPKYLQVYVDKVNNLKIFGDQIQANHILLNEYKAGQGILSHFDGPMFFPTISTLSIGSHTVLEFNMPQNAHDENSYKIVKEFKLLVAPRSLLILKDEMYSGYMHSISEIKEDDLTDPLLKNVDKNETDTLTLERSTRYSLTIRNVPKTSKMKLKFFK